MAARASAALFLSDVRAGYGDRPVLDGLDLTIDAGQSYALLGPNGAGKSTAARVACGLLRPSRGTVWIGGRDAWRGRRARRRVGLAPQDCALFSALTIRENLNTAARLAGLSRSEREVQVARAMRLTDCVARADQAVGTLSGGWKRRANLAAALIGQPTLLVVDEPTEGVDAPTRLIIVAALREALSEGAACLIISHDAAFVEMAADRIAVLARGRLAADGARRALRAAAFGDRRLLTIQFPAPPPLELSARLTQGGLSRDEAGLTWRLIAEDVLARAGDLAGAVDCGGGEMSIRRPGLDDIVARLAEAKT